MLELTVAMTRDVIAPDSLVQRVLDHFDAKGVVEVVATIAAYNMVSRFRVALNVDHRQGQKHWPWVANGENKAIRRSLMNHYIKAGILAGFLGGALSNALAATEGSHELDLKLRGQYWTEESVAYPTSTTPSPKPVSYEQAAIGAQLNYKSPFGWGVVGVDASAYGVLKLGDSGTPTSNFVDVGNNGQLQDGYLTPAVALVKFKWDKLVLVKVGRQLQDSLLLKSTGTRPVPDTYSGASASLMPLDGLKIYGAVYDQWRARSTGEFEKFRTEATGQNRIDYVSIFGASYVNGPFALTAEYLNSKSYLSKFGVVGAYTLPVRGTKLKLSSGLFTSRDAGSLFVCGAEKEMDCTGTSRIINDGMGVYLDADWKISNFTLGLAIAKFDGLWIEDNFAVDATKTGALSQDHGTNPFPTSAGLGPDMANNDELVTSVRLAYDWKDYVPGLKTSFKYSHGSGAHSSNRANTAEGKENYRLVEVRYDLPFVKNFGIRYLYQNYDSNISGFTTSATVKGMTRQDWEQHRVYIDYVYQF